MKYKGGGSTGFHFHENQENRPLNILIFDI